MKLIRLWLMLSGLVTLVIGASVIAAKQQAPVTVIPIVSAEHAFKKLQIASLTAITNVPSNAAVNVLDNNLLTHWSSQGKGSWIQLDLGKEKLVGNIEIAWYDGDEYESNFVVSISRDGSNYVVVYSGSSSGTTSGAEKYNFNDSIARYVKITVNGNTQNDWARIAEINVYGTDTDDGADASSTIDSPVDKFGIKQIYPTNTDGREWAANWDNGVARDVSSGDIYDSEFMPTGEFTRMYVDGNGTLEVQGQWPRFTIMDPNKVKTWKNVEITYYVNIINQYAGTQDYGIAAEARYGDFGPFPDGYQIGYSYNQVMRYAGLVFFQKEVADHCAYTSPVKNMYPWNTSDNSIPLNEWIGAKLIIRNNGSDHVHMELYIDRTNGLDGGDWHKLIEYTDSGGWFGNPGLDCANGYPYHDRDLDWVIDNATYGVRFRSDFADPVLWKNVSIREIAPLG